MRVILTNVVITFFPTNGFDLNRSFCCWGPHTPLMSELKPLSEIFWKALVLIRFDDYNYTVIL